MNKKSAFLICTALFFLTLTVRLWTALQFSQSPYFNFTLQTVVGPDQNTFFSWAHSIAGGSWSFHKLRPGEPFYLAPLYSTLMALFIKSGLGAKGVLGLQILFASSLVFGFYRVGVLLGNPRGGLIAALLWCFYGPGVFFDGCMIRASLAASLTFLLCWSLMEAEETPSSVSGWIRTGLLSGLLAALRPHLFFILVPLWIGFRFAGQPARLRVLSAACVFGASLVVISPITIRNLAVSGQFVPVASQGADAFWLGNTPDAMGVSYYPTAKSKSLLDESGNSLLRSLPILMREIAQDPSAYAKLYGRKLRMLLNDYEIPSNYNYYVYRRIVPHTRYLFVSFIWILPLAVLGLFFVRQNTRKAHTLYLFLGVSALSVLVIHIQARYRYPVVPFLILFAGLGLSNFVRLLYSKQILKIGAAVVLMAALVRLGQADPYYGFLQFRNKQGGVIAKQSKIRDVDYITWIASNLYFDNGDYPTAFRELAPEALGYFGPDFMSKYEKSLALILPERAKSSP